MSQIVTKQSSKDVDQTQYGQIKAAYFIIDQGNYGYKKVIKKCIEAIMKENQLLLKDLLEP